MSHLRTSALFIVFMLIIIPHAADAIPLKDISKLQISPTERRYISRLSAPTPVLQINISASNGEVLESIDVIVKDAGNYGDFNTEDLRDLTIDSSSGIAIYSDNEDIGINGKYDPSDMCIILKKIPKWTEISQGVYVTTLEIGSFSIPPNDTSQNSGFDFFIVVRTSSKCQNADDFIVGIKENGIKTSSGNITFTEAYSNLISVDAIPPSAYAGRDDSIEEDATYIFYGGGSYDNIGIVNYTWKFGDGYVGYGVRVNHTFTEPMTYNVILNVTDAAGNSDEDSMTLVVLDVNQAPTITSKPIDIAYQDTMYVYLCTAEDEDDDKISYLLEDFPTGMEIDSITGLIKWLPSSEDVGTHTVKIIVKDERGAETNQTYNITVINKNDPPIFKSKPPRSAIQHQTYIYEVICEDPDGDDVYITIESGPEGMTLDEEKKVIKWTPTSSHFDTVSVLLKATDGFLYSYQSFTINITNVNDPPEITSKPVYVAVQGIGYVYDVDAYDADDDILIYYLDTFPDGMTINSSTGVIYWVPSPTQVGEVNVVVCVKDTVGGTDRQEFKINVKNVNDPPIIRSNPITVVRQNEIYRYCVTAEDYDGDALFYSLVVFPRGMVINATTGIITWTPTSADVGKRQVTICVNDGHGGKVYQTYYIIVKNVNDPPVVVGDIERYAFENEMYVSKINAYDPDGDLLRYEMCPWVNIPNMRIDKSTGIITWIPTSPGNITIVVNISDTNGAYVIKSFEISVQDKNDPPVIEYIPRIIKCRVGEKVYVKIKSSDPDGDRIYFQDDSKIFNIRPYEGIISFTPSENDVGIHEANITIIDSRGEKTNATIIIYVKEEKKGDDIVWKGIMFTFMGLGGMYQSLFFIILFIFLGIVVFNYLYGTGKAKTVMTLMKSLVSRPVCTVCNKKVGKKYFKCRCGKIYHIKCIPTKCKKCGRVIKRKKRKKKK